MKLEVIKMNGNGINFNLRRRNCEKTLGGFVIYNVGCNGASIYIYNIVNKGKDYDYEGIISLYNLSL